MLNKITWKHGLLVLLVVLVLRLPAFWTPILDVDESQFAGFAHSLIAGETPYIESLDTKPLGVYFFYAAVFKLFGTNNMIAVHIVTAFWVALTAFFCFRIGRKIHSPHAGFWAALFYAIFTTTFVPKFIGTSILILLMLPMTISIDAVVSWENSKKLRHILIAGIAWGVACLFKYQAGINLIIMGFYLLIFHPIFVEKSWRGIKILPYIVFLVGGALVAGIFSLYLVAIGAWGAFYFWSIQGSLGYVSKATHLIDYWNKLATRGGGIVASSILVWFLAIWQMAKLVVSGIRHFGKIADHRSEYLIMIWLAFSFIPVGTGGKFYGHYFLQLYPALCILGGITACSFLTWISKKPRTLTKGLSIALFTFFLIFPALGFFGARLAADQIYASVGEENPKTYIPVAEYIANNSSEEDRIFVWGFATPIYTYSNRLSASRFLWCDWLTGRVSGTPSAKDPNFDTSEYIVEGSWKMFFEDMEKNKPTYFVDTSPGNHHDYGKYPIYIYPDLAKFLLKRYHLEKSINGVDIYRINK
jgi:4-amino-4-deoxy-L-arabinose transferase-like glycosyltransferase